ncbi:endothelin-converting enzyme 1-like isoform X2 [Photinus pyralis]|nr:endothelin-converting enzyme 1-like isoform X2 [Photinus pyralis]
MITATVVFTLFTVAHTKVPFFLLPREDASTGEQNVDLCADFYDFACRAWANVTVPYNHSVWNNWEIITKKVNRQLEDLLIADERLGNARQMYMVCIQDDHPHRNVHVLQTLLKDLGGWPVVFSAWNEKGFEWERTVAQVIRTLGVYPLLKIHVFVDLQSTMRHTLYVEQGESNLPPAIFTHRHQHLLGEYKKWISNTLSHLYPDIQLNFTTQIVQMIDFECALSNLTIFKNKHDAIDKVQLSKRFALNWKTLFKTLFHNQSTFGEKIIVRSPQYIKELVRLISATDKRTIANYIMWTVVRALSRDVTDHLRALNFQMNHVVFGLRADYSRHFECTKEVMEYMDVVLIKSYTHRYIPDGAFIAIRNMIINIKTHFIKILNENTWLDNSTKKDLIEKVAAIKHVIAFNNEIDRQAQQLRKLTLSNNHLLNVIKLCSFKSRYNLENLNRKVNFKWTDSLFEVNAYYSVLQNTIFIPVGMLESPFFNLSAPIAYNYGALGSIIGHEISHALDTSGRHADKNGNVGNWWQSEAIRIYNEKTNCFAEQSGASEDLSLGENIADNVGLRISFNALSDLERKGNKLGEQLFFMSFAQVWCEARGTNEIEDEHAPAKVRVLTTLNNRNEFFNSFHCPQYTHQKCTLWVT